jgi:hypothetical protein
MNEIIKTFGNLSDDAQFSILIMFWISCVMIIKVVRIIKAK